MKTHPKLIGLMVVGLFFASTVGWGQDAAESVNRRSPGPRRAAVRARCRADVEQHCSEVKPGKGRIRACLRENQTNISEDCRRALAGAQGRAVDDAVVEPRAETPQPPADSSPPPPSDPSASPDASVQ